MSKQIKMGQQVTDNITGFSGVAVARAEYLYGCVRVAVEGKEKPGDAIWFDEQRLTGESPAKSGGDMPSPPRRDP